MTFVILIAIPLVGAYWIYHEFRAFEDNVAVKREHYIASQKQFIKNEVNKVVENINYHKELNTRQLQAKLKRRINEIHAIMTGMYKKYHGMVPDEQLQEMIETVISSPYGSGQGYYFALDFDCYGIVYPNFSKHKKKSQADRKDFDGKHFLAEMVEAAKELGESFYQYRLKRSDESKPVTKLSFVKVFEPFGWVIGTGEDLEASEQELKELLLAQIDTVRSGDDGYIYVFDYDGVCLSHYKQSYVGENRWDYEDSRGVKLIQQIISSAKNKSSGSYLEYIGSIKPSTEQPAQKLGYIVGIPEWNWAVGSGVYIDDMESAITDMRHQLIDDVKRKILAVIAVFSLFILICYFIAKFLAKKVQNDFDRFTDFFHDSLNRSINLDVNDFDLDEFEQLAVSANRMIEQRNQVEEAFRHSQKMDTIGQLAGGIAHDFNNALGGVKGSVSMIRFLLKKDDVDLTQVDELMELVEKSSDSAAGIVNQLLTLSQKHELDLKPIDFNTVLKKTILLCDSALDKRVNLVPKYLKHDAVIKADEVQLEQVLLNLCINASHAMTIMREKKEDFGGTLTVELDEFTPDNDFLAVYGEAKLVDYYVCRISDTGIGMSPSVIENIFNPFFTTKSKEHGTGLGLSMVDRIIQQHGGVCNVFSKEGAGSTFNIFIPKCHDGSVDCGSESQPVVKGQGMVLVVDDESYMRSTANNILTECGYDVVLSCDGSAAIDEFSNMSDQIDLIILDMSMPILSGKDTYIKLKEIRHDVKVLLASGHGLDERIEETLSLGACGFIQKPYTIEELSRKVNDVIV